MKQILLAITTALSLIISTGAQNTATKTPLLLIHGHSHNDYAHARPLFDALDHGFCSIEADIYLIDGQLLVAHDRDKVDPKKTLQALYLDPMRERIKQNGGRLYAGGPECILLIDVKTDAEKTYRVLSKVLEGYADIFTRFEPGHTRTNALTAVISGNRAEKLMAGERVRYAGYDGRLPDLDANPGGPDLIPMISHNWTLVFQWRGEGSMPSDQKAKLKQIVDRTHQQGRWLRFWATPDKPAVWNELCAAGVDFISADDLAGLQKFFADRKNSEAKSRR